MTRYTRIVPRMRIRIIGALLVVLLGTAQGIAAVCDSFCPAHAGAAVEVTSHAGAHHGAPVEPSATPTHAHGHAAAREVAPPSGLRIDAESGPCCATSGAPKQTLTAARGSSGREGIAAASVGTPAVAPRRADAPLRLEVGPPSGPASRPPSIQILRI